MADLPPARLRIHQPAFYSTVHIDILTSIDTDSFLMALRRFISRRSKPFELLADQGTNFEGGERELKESYPSPTRQPTDQIHLQSTQCTPFRWMLGERNTLLEGCTSSHHWRTDSYRRGTENYLHRDRGNPQLQTH
ncbi:hypothetical protein QQF64_023391 [Cirrhinus molitorella]|uniref:Integrase catalytic domain-containing protein n=1 Tax=Cirrhinus molitorella TaxID=172907 RepID=A0ABR3L509_9TELE